MTYHIHRHLWHLRRRWRKFKRRGKPWQLPPMAFLDEPAPSTMRVLFSYQPRPSNRFIPVYSYGKRKFTIDRKEAAH